MILMSSSIVVYQISTVFLYTSVQNITNKYTRSIRIHCRTEIILFYEHKWFAANKVQLRRKHAIFSKMAYTRMPSHEIKRKARQVLLHLLTKVSHLDKGIC